MSVTATTFGECITWEGGGGNLHMKGAGMLVVSLRDVNL